MLIGEWWGGVYCSVVWWAVADCSGMKFVGLQMCNISFGFSEIFEYLCDLSRQQNNLLLRNILSNSIEPNTDYSSKWSIGTSFWIRTVVARHYSFKTIDAKKLLFEHSYVSVFIFHAPNTVHRDTNYIFPNVILLLLCSPNDWLHTLSNCFMPHSFAKMEFIWRLYRWDSKMG